MPDPLLGEPTSTLSVIDDHLANCEKAIARGDKASAERFVAAVRALIRMFPDELRQATEQELYESLHDQQNGGRVVINRCPLNLRGFDVTRTTDLADISGVEDSMRRRLTPVSTSTLFKIEAMGIL